MKNYTNPLKALGLFFSIVLISSCTKPAEDKIVDPLAAEQYFTFSINGLPGATTTPADSVGASRSGSNTNLYGTKADGSLSLFATITGDALSGNYPMTYMNLYVNNKHYVSTTTPLQVFVSAYGDVGGYITGSYSGAMKDSIGTNSYNINGVFKLKRKQ